MDPVPCCDPRRFTAHDTVTSRGISPLCILFVCQGHPCHLLTLGTIYLWLQYREDWFSGCGLDLYCGSAQFESRQGHQLYWGLSRFFSVPLNRNRDCSSIIPLQLPSKCFPINYLSAILLFDAIETWRPLAFMLSRRHTILAEYGDDVSDKSTLVLAKLQG
jgi:hypothetical protein